MKSPTVGDKVAVLDNEIQRYVSATVTSVYNGPRQAKVAIDGTEDTALLPWVDLHPTTWVGRAGT